MKNEIMLKEVPEWLPDWKKIEEYNFDIQSDINKKFDKGIETRVAWEFLRRNKLYNETFLEIKSELIEWYSKKEDKSLYEDKIKKLRSGKFDFLTSSCAEINKKINNEILQWGIPRYFNPRSERPIFLKFRNSTLIIPNFNSASQEPTEDKKERLKNSMEFEIPDGYSAIMINMRKPLAPQLKSAEVEIESIKNSLFLRKYKEEKRNNFKRNNIDMYLKFIRLADAMIHGERPRDIKKVIYAGVTCYDIDEQFKTDKKRVIELINYGYKNFLVIQ